MKKILCFMTVLIALMGVSNTFASSISQAELDKQTKEGNILSDGYTSQSECTNLKEKYNQEFSNYKRSDCFSNGGKYHYFICPSSSACSVNLTGGTTTTTTTTTTNVANKDKLDIFLNKVATMRKEINDDTKYKLLLTQVKGQLQTLGAKYKSNTTISQMLSYLDSGIQKIQTELENNTDVDNFLCELLGNCEKSVPVCPIMSAPYCQYGSPILKRSYKDAAGCDRQEYECPDSSPGEPACTREYAPVCAQPPMPSCPPGVGCVQVMPKVKTYSNSCMAGAEKAAVLYKGECTTTPEKSDSEKLVINLYKEILKRDPESTGLAYWAGQLNNGKLTQSNISIAIACAAISGQVQTDKTNAQNWARQNNVNCGTTNSSSSTSSSSTSGGATTTSSSSTSSGGGTTSTSSSSTSSSSTSGGATTTSSSSTSSSGGPKTGSSSSSTSSSGGDYPSGSWEPQEQMNARYGCTGTVPTYAQVGTLQYVGFQEVPGRNTVWRSYYSLSEADKNSDAWKSCTWYCDMNTAWNGNRCVTVGNIRFSTTQVKIGSTISGVVTTNGYTDSYYTCMETPDLPNNCANGANFSQLSKNSDWSLNGNTFSLNNYPITSAFKTGQYTGYVAVAENGVVKEPHRTARRHSFNVVPGDTGGVTPTTTPPTIYLYMAGDVLRGTIKSVDPSNTWACMDVPGGSNCSNRSSWSKMPAPGWTQTADGFILSDYNLAGSPRGKYTGYVSIGNNGSIGSGGSSSFTY